MGLASATESYAASALYTTLASLSGAVWRIRRVSSIDARDLRYSLGVADALLPRQRELKGPMCSAEAKPPIPQLSSADEIQVRRALRRNRLLATGLLVFMIFVAALTRLEPSPGWLV